MFENRSSIPDPNTIQPVVGSFDYLKDPTTFIDVNEGTRYHRLKIHPEAQFVIAQLLSLIAPIHPVSPISMEDRKQYQFPDDHPIKESDIKRKHFFVSTELEQAPNTTDLEYEVLELVMMFCLNRFDINRPDEHNFIHGRYFDFEDTLRGNGFPKNADYLHDAIVERCKERGSSVAEIDAITCRTKQALENLQSVLNDDKYTNALLTKAVSNIKLDIVKWYKRAFIVMKVIKPIKRAVAKSLTGFNRNR